MGNIIINNQNKNIHDKVLGLPPHHGGAGLTSTKLVNEVAYYGNLIFIMDYLQKYLVNHEKLWNSEEHSCITIPSHDQKRLTELLPHYISRQGEDVHGHLYYRFPFRQMTIPQMENDADLYSNDHRQSKMMDKAHGQIKTDLQNNLHYDGILDVSARFGATPRHANAFAWLYSAIN